MKPERGWESEGGLRSNRCWRLWLLFVVPALWVQVSTADSGVGNQGRLESILSEYEAATARLSTLQANLVYTKTNKLMQLSETIRAKLKMKRPRKLRMDVSDPTPSKKIVNGDIAWIYEPQLNQAQKFRIADGARQLRDVNPLELAYTGKLDELKKHYTISLVGEETSEAKTFAVIGLKLRDREAESRFASLRLKMVVGQWIPVEITTADEAGDVEEVYKLDDLVLNAQLSDSEFVFTPPAGVEVVEPQRE